MRSRHSCGGSSRRGHMAQTVMLDEYPQSATHRPSILFYGKLAVIFERKDAKSPSRNVFPSSRLGAVASWRSYSEAPKADEAVEHLVLCGHSFAEPPQE